MIIKELFVGRIFSVICLTKRSLFNHNFLGVSSYSENRNKFLASQQAVNFMQSVQESYENPNKNITTEQVKYMSFFVKTVEETKLVKKALEKYGSSFSLSKIVFQRFTCGPELMRMYHFFNLPLEGYELIKNPVTSPLFDDVKSYFIIQDLLYNNEFYKEVCELFRILQDKEIHGRRFPFLNYILFQAACYKMVCTYEISDVFINFQKTPSSYKEAMDVYQEFVIYYKYPAWPILMYTLLLALENGNASLPLQYKLGKDSFSDNIRLIAVMRMQGVMQALNYYSKLNKSNIIKSVASELHTNIEKSNDRSINVNIDINSFKDETLEDLAAQTIHSLNHLNFFPK